MLNKGALSLLSCYESDSSDDEVPGPRVAAKRPYKNDQHEPCPKRLQKLPVPDICIKNASANEEYVDDPTSHDGRIRTFLHERGNWATYIYIPFKGHEAVRDFISLIKNSVPHIDLKEVDDFHISLTKTVILRYHWIDTFVNSIKSITSCFRKFMILFNGIKIYCNEERTRTFIGLQTRTGYDSLLKIAEELNRSLGEFGLPPFYKDPSFHMSIAWCVGDFEKELNLILPRLNHQLEELMESYPQDNWYIYCEYLMCKTGNKYFQFYLT
ncbi:hypothetical protein NQ317_010558 [Molorchus minor]|uniref:U6 snRNA phosphodiesterase n=1 Tax=Molorchus minor TaxID=1323400 RepID=A0ABQ9JA46_9CUCU|nr:hypothetical protein NQ317_010558 [Molorchus minor]